MPAHALPLPECIVMVKNEVVDGERRKVYRCEYCLREFNRLEHCQRHVLIHTKTKPFPCHLCTKGFSRADEVIRHARRIHNVDISKRTVKGLFGSSSSVLLEQASGSFNNDHSQECNNDAVIFDQDNSSNSINDDNGIGYSTLRMTLEPESVLLIDGNHHTSASSSISNRKTNRQSSRIKKSISKRKSAKESAASEMAVCGGSSRGSSRGLPTAEVHINNSETAVAGYSSRSLDQYQQHHDISSGPLLLQPLPVNLSSVSSRAGISAPNEFHLDVVANSNNNTGGSAGGLFMYQPTAVGSTPPLRACPSTSNKFHSSNHHPHHRMHRSSSSSSSTVSSLSSSSPAWFFPKTYGSSLRRPSSAMSMDSFYNNNNIGGGDSGGGGGDGNNCQDCLECAYASASMNWFYGAGGYGSGVAISGRSVPSSCSSSTPSSAVGSSDSAVADAGKTPTASTTPSLDGKSPLSSITSSPYSIDLGTTSYSAQTVPPRSMSCGPPIASSSSTSFSSPSSTPFLFNPHPSAHSFNQLLLLNKQTGVDTVESHTHIYDLPTTQQQRQLQQQDYFRFRHPPRATPPPPSYLMRSVSLTSPVAAMVGGGGGGGECGMFYDGYFSPTPGAMYDHGVNHLLPVPPVTSSCTLSSSAVVVVPTSFSEASPELYFPYCNRLNHPPERSQSTPPYILETAKEK